MSWRIWWGLGVTSCACQVYGVLYGTLGVMNGLENTFTKDKTGDIIGRLRRYNISPNSSGVLQSSKFEDIPSDHGFGTQQVRFSPTLNHEGQ